MKLSTLLYFCFVMFCEGKSWSCHLVMYKCATFLSSLFRPQALRGRKGWRSIRGHIKIYSNGRSCQATNALSVFLSVQYVYVYVCVCVCHALIVCTHESLLFEAEQEMEMRAFTRVVPPSMKKSSSLSIPQYPILKVVKVKGLFKDSFFDWLSSIFSDIFLSGL